MRIRFFIGLLLLPFPAAAGWTGVGAFIGQSETDWHFAGHLMQADIHQYGLHVEEKTQLDLRVGASAGQFSLRLQDPLNVWAADKFYGQFLSIYLRLPTPLMDGVRLHTRLSYQLNLGKQSINTDNTEIDWSELSFEAGISVQLGLLSIRPFLSFRSIDGDITSNLGTWIFKRNKHRSSGLILDYYVERSAYIRLMSTFDNNPSLQLSFVREY